MLRMLMMFLWWKWRRSLISWREQRQNMECEWCDALDSNLLRWVGGWMAEQTTRLRRWHQVADECVSAAFLTRLAINQCLSMRIQSLTCLLWRPLNWRFAFDDHPHSHKMTIHPHLATSPSAHPPPSLVFPPQTCPSLPHTMSFPHCHMATTLRHPSQASIRATGV